MKNLSELFEVKNSTSLELINCKQIQCGIPFISRTSENNGVAARIVELDWLDPMPANAITVALSGSVLSSFYQEECFYTAFHVACLYPKQNLSKEQMLYYTYIIEQNKYRYNYGRQANKTLKNLLVPNIDELPDYLNKISLSEYKFDFIPINTPLSLDTDNWKWFEVGRLFNYKRGTRLTKENREYGNIPLVTAGAEKEGVAGYISNEEMKKHNNAITIDMFGCAFYRGYIFCCDDNILILTPKTTYLNQYIGLFISSVLNIDGYKCAYGRQYRQKTLEQHKIKLPATKEGNPDWQFMEDYIKGLPYSKCL